MVFRAFKFKALLLTFIDQLLFTRKAAKDARRKPPSLERAPINQDFCFFLKKKKANKKTDRKQFGLDQLYTNEPYVHSLFSPIHPYLYKAT